MRLCLKVAKPGNAEHSAQVQRVMVESLNPGEARDVCLNGKGLRTLVAEVRVPGNVEEPRKARLQHVELDSMPVHFKK